MRVLIISDVHANLQALESVLQEAGDIDDVWSLGDIVGYGPNPRECVEVVRTLAPNVSIIGNHDWAAIGRLSLDDFNPVARFAAYWTTMQIGAEHLRYLESLPDQMIDRHWTVVHGSPRNPIWEYVYNARIAALNFPLFDTRLCFVGHTHVPLYFREEETMASVTARHPVDGETIDLSEGRFMINPGSVGQPRDGDDRAAFAVFESESLWLTFRRVAYSIERTQEQMRVQGLPESLISRLSHGI